MSIQVGAAAGKDYFLRSYYSSNRDARKKTTRSNMNTYTKTTADTQALTKALKDLQKIDYDNTEKDGEVYNKMLAFVSAYNNTMESGSEGDEDIKHLQKSMKKITQKYEKQWKELGVTLQKDGTMKLADNSGDKFSLSKMKELFSKKSSNYAEELARCAQKMKKQADDAWMSGSFDVLV